MNLWTFLVVGYVLTVAVECPVLLLGLSPRHSLHARFFSGFWLTACTYPMVILAFPAILPRPYYVPVAEIFAAVAECALFAELFRGRWNWRDMAVIVAANAASFGVGCALFG